MEGKSNSVDRLLRIITVLGWPPAMAFLIAVGVKCHIVFPTLGLLPMTISSCMGVIYLLGQAKNRTAVIIMDLFCALFFISMLVPGWVELSSGLSRHGWLPRDMTMVGTYGTLPLMVNFTIHAYFVLREIDITNLFKRKTCPHCHGEIGHSRPRLGQYQQVNGEEAPDSDEKKPTASSSKEPRASTDDETARLV